MRKTNCKTGSSLLLMLGMTLPAIGTAAAPSQFEDASVRISYADLDIQSEAGARVLYSRLKRASERACNKSSYWERASISMTVKAEECYREALTNAVESVGSDALKKIHAG